MRFLALCGVVWLSLLMGVAAAADIGEVDWMALRGDAGDGRTQVNAFQSPWRSFDAGRGIGDGPSPIALRSAGSVPGDAGYMQWKNSCVLVPPVVAGEALPINGRGDFGTVSPYLEKADPGAGDDRFLEALAVEFGKGDGSP